MSFLAQIGWNAFFENSYQENTLPSDQQSQAKQTTHRQPARICGHERGCYFALLADGSEVKVFLLKSRRQKIHQDFGLPTVGDWVIVEQEQSLNTYRICSVLARQSVLYRPTPGQSQKKQNLAANVDLAFVIMSLNEDFNLRRLDRYLTLIMGAQVTPIVILSKADLCENPQTKVLQITKNYPNLKVLVLSIVQDQGLSQIRALLNPGKTAVLLGSSGVGKSSLVNALMGKHSQSTNTIRASDGRGRHTTSGRHLILLENESILIDSPGIRELQMNADPQNLLESFKDILLISNDCKFSNCLHRTEPRCAVKLAISEGRISLPRFEHFEKLMAESSTQNTGRAK